MRIWDSLVLGSGRCIPRFASASRLPKGLRYSLLLAMTLDMPYDACHIPRRTRSASRLSCGVVLCSQDPAERCETAGTTCAVRERARLLEVALPCSRAAHTAAVSPIGTGFVGSLAGFRRFGRRGVSSLRKTKREGAAPRKDGGEGLCLPPHGRGLLRLSSQW